MLPAHYPRLLSATLLVCFLACFPRRARAEDASFVGADEPATASAVYGQGVRETEWQAAEVEQAGFHLPPGFAVQLFASEPRIAKPLNMAWDARGRLWVTSTVEYPYPVENGAPDTASEKPSSSKATQQPRDTIKILEDTNGDGRADKSTTFADNLNIPMGLLPMPDGVICFSIPNLWYLRDTNGDDRVDERIKLLGPFDTSRDTHGLINSLRRGDDGWIYACHGFNNQSRVSASDGSSVHLISGNTFRFQHDGSRVEHFTHGQVNPFGMTVDEWGNWYTADCHSKPLTALLAEACYPSFGRPHDGLGFAPPMMDHLHGSTAISGVVYYQAEHFPAAYRHRFYSGNVMTSRINCNALQWRDSTAQARELPDFMTSDDPWFRPVDIQLGPDGALYVADFYNKIIGHYEVPLDHPGRDRDSGRIWRIVYRGDQPHSALESLATAPGSWRAKLGSTNITRRKLAIDTCLDQSRWPTSEVLALLRDSQQSELLRLSCLEIICRRGELNFDTLAFEPNSPHQRLAASLIRLAAELPEERRGAWLPSIRQGVPYNSSQLNRSACRLLAVAGDERDVAPLEKFMSAIADDPAAVHVARIALRDILQKPHVLEAVTADWPASEASDGVSRVGPIDSSSAHSIAQVLPAIDSRIAAERLLDFVAYADQARARPLLESAIPAATKYASPPVLSKLLAAMSRFANGDLLTKSQQFERVCESYLVSHPQLAPELKQFGLQLQQQMAGELSLRLAASGGSSEWSDASGAGWQTQTRHCTDGSDAVLRSSITRGEQYTGTLLSEPFDCPGELRFWLAGHNGPPSADDHRKNSVQLRQAITGQILATAYPPRNDIAREVVWRLSALEGQAVRVHTIDGDSGRAYAWLAVGRFSVSALNPGSADALLDGYRGLLRRGLLPNPAEQIAELELLSPRQRAGLIAAGLQGASASTASSLTQQALRLDRADLISTRLLRLTTLPATERQMELLELARALALSATTAQQTGLATTLLESTEGCRLLQPLLASGTMSLQSLRDSENLIPSSLDAETRNFLQQQLELAQSLESSEPSADERLSSLAWRSADLNSGQQLFRQYCATCHQLAGEGTLIGPQLDGAVVRGIQRLGEDILAPNVNVDKAFRISSLLLDNDQVLSGLVRDDPDGSLVIIGQDGKLQRIGSQRVVQRRDSSSSLMPNNFGELLNDQQLVSLLHFITSRAGKE